MIEKEIYRVQKRIFPMPKEFFPLIKFATHIPIFMYLTDYREMTLTDVITKLEPKLFRKVTGLDVKDFNLLVSLGVFNSAHMNGAIYNFKRYEDSSLAYTGIDKHEGEDVGLYDTKLKSAEYKATFINEEPRRKQRGYLHSIGNCVNNVDDCTCVVTTM
jgi:hypothetical protein